MLAISTTHTLQPLDAGVHGRVRARLSTPTMSTPKMPTAKMSMSQIVNISECQLPKSLNAKCQLIQTSLYRSRRARLPSLPRSRGDIQLEGEWTETTNSFLLCSDGEEDKILIFATDEHLEMLANAERVYMDGTFQICPRLFYQLFNINVFIHQQHFPVVYCLLPRKTWEVYNRAFTLVKEAAQNLHLEINPELIMTDFEHAL